MLPPRVVEILLPLPWWWLLTWRLNKLCKSHVLHCISQRHKPNLKLWLWSMISFYECSLGSQVLSKQLPILLWCQIVYWAMANGCHLWLHLCHTPSYNHNCSIYICIRLFSSVNLLNYVAEVFPFMYYSAENRRIFTFGWWSLLEDHQWNF
jgi:hypothetical protein